MFGFWKKKEKLPRITIIEKAHNNLATKVSNLQNQILILRETVAELKKNDDRFKPKPSLVSLDGTLAPVANTEFFYEEANPNWKLYINQGEGRGERKTYVGFFHSASRDHYLLMCRATRELAKLLDSGKITRISCIKLAPIKDGSDKAISGKKYYKGKLSVDRQTIRFIPYKKSRKLASQKKNFFVLNDHREVVNEEKKQWTQEYEIHKTRAGILREDCSLHGQKGVCQEVSSDNNLLHKENQGNTYAA